MSKLTTTVLLLCAGSWNGTVLAQSNPVSSGSEVVPKRFVGLRYPRLAHLAAVQGSVKLQAAVSPEGTVTDVKVVSGHPLLVDAAKASLRSWLFSGCNVQTGCVATATFVFVLSDGSCDISECPNDVQIDLPNTVTIKSIMARAIID